MRHAHNLPLLRPAQAETEQLILVIENDSRADETTPTLFFIAQLCCVKP
jgi:hypothetical protein